MKKKSAGICLLFSALAIPLSGCSKLQHVQKNCQESNASNERPLTSGEKHLAKAIFGNEIKTNNITIHMCDNSAPITKAKTVSETDIMLWNAFNDSDFSDKQSLNKNANVLLHELTHIWQLQNNDRFTDKSAKIETVNDKTNPYQYRLNKRSKFEEFGIEQQASLIGHYYLLFFSADAQAYRADY